MADIQTCLSLFFVCLITTILIWSRFFKSTSTKYRHPPTPFGLPIIGHLHLLAPIPHQAFHKLSIRHGSFFRVFMGYVPSFVVCSPEIAKEFLRTNEKSFSNRTQSSASHYLLYESKDFVFAPYGPYWTFMKKMIMSQLLNKTTLDSHATVRRDEIDRFLKTLSQNAKIGKSLDLGGELMKLTNNVISRMIIGKRCTDDDGKEDEVSKLISEISVALGTFNPSDFIRFCKNIDFTGFGRKLKDIRARYDIMIEKVIKEHEEARKNNESGEVRDLLDMLLDIEQDTSMEIKLSKENIKALIQDLFVAATDTSSRTLEWIIAEFINHPNIMKKAREEINQVVGKNRLVQESDIPNLPYLQAIVKETFRLHPSTPMIQRQSPKDCTVAANTNVLINVWALNRDPNHWEKPLEFRPERFEDNMLDVRGQHFHFLTFGSGRRMCPGISLAHFMVHTTLGAMIQCFDWKAGKDGNLTSVDMEEGTGLTLPRANPLVCIPVARLVPIPFSL
nr:cytochrome P450 93A3-like [Tanacetum cinerariifolium]